MTETANAVLHLTLRSAATFGRGDGVAGLVDREVEQDRYGFPFLRGRTLKGLLREAAEEVVFAFEQQQDGKDWRKVKDDLFGQPSSNLEWQGKLHVSDARLPWALRRQAMEQIDASRQKPTLDDQKLTPDDVLQSLTGIRRQTAMNHYGAPDHATLRSMRVILRGVSFESELSFTTSPTDDEWTLLAAATLNLRAAGTGRNRGRGWLRATLIDEEAARRHLDRLQPQKPQPQE